MTFERGFRNPIGAIGGIAGANGTERRMIITNAATSTAQSFSLTNPANHLVFYRLDYSATYSAEGHVTTSPTQQYVLCKLVDDSDLLIPAWRVYLSLALPATEIGNIAIAGTGFDITKGIAFPIGEPAKLVAETAVDTVWPAGAFTRWSARFDVTVLVKEVSP